MNKIILVFYINVGNQTRIRAKRSISKFIANISTIDGDDENIIKYFVAVRDRDSEVVCLNPVLMTDEQYAETKSLLDDVKAKMDIFLKEESTEAND